MSATPVVLLNETLGGLIRTCYRRGPFLKAVSDAATVDRRFETDWAKFLGAFDDVGCARIEADQEQGLIPGFDPRPVTVALNRMNAYSIIEAFGQRPRSQPGPLHEALRGSGFPRFMVPSGSRKARRPWYENEGETDENYYRNIFVVVVGPAVARSQRGSSCANDPRLQQQDTGLHFYTGYS